MKKNLTLAIVLMLVQLSCNILDPNPATQLLGRVLPYNELPSSLIPPCLNTSGCAFSFVIKNSSDYDSLKIAHAPQGPYENFIADGSTTSFQLSYQPLDADGDGKIGTQDLIIYVKGQPIFVEYNGKLIHVDSNPFYVIGDSILTFNDTTYVANGKVPCSMVFNVDPISGQVVFNSPPPNGNKISISASRTLYDSYQGRGCNMDNFNFSSHSIIGFQVLGDGCLKGLEKQFFIKDVTKQIIFHYKLLKERPSGGCPEILVTITTWVQIPKIPDGYHVVFQEVH